MNFNEENFDRIRADRLALAKEVGRDGYNGSTWVQAKKLAARILEEEGALPNDEMRDFEEEKNRDGKIIGIARSFGSDVHVLGDRASGAAFSSPDEKTALHRYMLWRLFDPMLVAPGAERWVNFVMLNPSTADHQKPDKTISRCVGFAKLWGYDGIVVTNLFSWRSTDRSVLPDVDDPEGDANEVNITLIRSVGRCAALVVCAWGNDGYLRGRAGKVTGVLPSAKCFRITKEGAPEHPLYMPAKQELRAWP
ncbi:MAG: DUF1643 domain-containing protein [Polyangiaceae bacterium]|nr:DUF1643 domain-containing protein [Polyangiaceae bacterium]